MVTSRQHPSCLLPLLMLIAFSITPLQVYGGRPGFEVLRYEEDWSRFDHSASEYFGENFKNIPLDAGDASTLTLGGQFQALYELTRHGEWGEAPEQHEGVLYDRYLFHGDLRLGRRLRFFGEAISGFSHGESGRAATAKIGSDCRTCLWISSGFPQRVRNSPCGWDANSSPSGAGAW